MMTPRYEYVYDTVFRFLHENNITTYPVCLDAICKVLNARLMTVAQATMAAGIRYEDLKVICGNADGAVFTLLAGGCKLHTILYDHCQPSTRQRFTIAEECAHILLGHVNDFRFNILEASDNRLYQAYEVEARTAAGLLLCPPKLLTLCANVLEPVIIGLACDISEDCAAVRIAQHRAFHKQMLARESYDALPAAVISSGAARHAIHKKLMEDAHAARRQEKNRMRTTQ